MNAKMGGTPISMLQSKNRAPEGGQGPPGPNNNRGFVPQAMAGNNNHVGSPMVAGSVGVNPAGQPSSFGGAEQLAAPIDPRSHRAVEGDPHLKGVLPLGDSPGVQGVGVEPNNTIQLRSKNLLKDLNISIEGMYLPLFVSIIYYIAQKKLLYRFISEKFGSGNVSLGICLIIIFIVSFLVNNMLLKN